MVKAVTRAARLGKAGKVATRATQPLVMRARTKKEGTKVKVAKLATREVKAVRVAKAVAATRAARAIKQVIKTGIRTVARAEPKAAQANSMPKRAGKATRMTNADF